MKTLDYIQLTHGDAPTHSVIWLHGLGADGNDFSPVIPELGLPPTMSIKFILPHAPARPVTINGGMVMPAWYDIRGAEIADREDREGMQQSRDWIMDLVNMEIQNGIPASRIVLAGFSQGGAVAIYTVTRADTQFAGLMALSTYLPFAAQAAEEDSGINKDIPFFMGHGSFDPMIPVGLAEKSRDRLKELGYQPQWHTYPMPHSVSPQEIADISAWLQEVVTASSGD